MSRLRDFLRRKATQIEGAIEYAVATESHLIDVGYNNAIIGDVVIGYVPERIGDKLFIVLEFSNEELEKKIEEYNKKVNVL